MAFDLDDDELKATRKLNGADKSDLLTRLNEEIIDLQEKTERLRDFIISEDYKKLSNIHQWLLEIQFNSMLSYLNTLITRENLIYEESRK